MEFLNETLNFGVDVGLEVLLLGLVGGNSLFPVVELGLGLLVFG